MQRRTFLKQASLGIGVPASLPPGLAKEAKTAPSMPAGGEESQGFGTNPRSSQEGTGLYRRIKEYLDRVPSIDMHEHLRAFDQLPGYVETGQGRGMNLCGLWAGSYLQRVAPLTPWEPKEQFETWWGRAKTDFVNVRATGFYRYMWLALRDLYGVDFDSISDEQAAQLNRRIFESYRDPRWLYQVLAKKANIQLLVCDRYWERFNFRADYPFELLTLNVTTLVWGFHPTEFDKSVHPSQILGPLDNPYLFAQQRGLPLNSLDDYLALLDVIFVTAKQGDAVCLKTTQAYVRTLRFENVPKEQAAKAFGNPRSELTPEQIKDFEDFIMWRLVELCAKHDMPFQIHTGDARIAGSSPMLLVNLIDANPRTKFELFHGGYPWIGETGAIGMKYADHVWINSVWLPTISFTMAKRAFHEWLEVVPSNRITWGGDDTSAEGIYGETELTRRCLAEVLAEKVDWGELSEPDARQIGKSILRDNALELYPRLKSRL
ncbi:MAG: amidohydrolase family protein [Terriglobia bacterium]